MVGMLREYLSLPYLLTKVFIKNASGKGKYKEEAYQYGTDKAQEVIIIGPKNKPSKNTTIFFCHGGGWEQGSPRAFRFVGYFFASFGYTTILAGYRKVPMNVYPSQVDDTLNSLIYGIGKLKEQGLYNDKVLFVGQSAGAHLVTYLAYTDVLKKAGFDMTSIKGVVSISGPINLSECKSNYIRKILAKFVVTDESKKLADPYAWVKSDVNIPILCIHGDSDPLVEPANSESFVRKINEINEGLGTIKLIKGGLHSNLARLFWKGLKDYAEMIDWISL